MLCGRNTAVWQPWWRTEISWGRVTDGKNSRKFWWLDEWQIEETESWLSDMAVQGWHLLNAGKSFALFVQGPSKKVRYRCDIFAPRHPQYQERLELYQASGWEYIGRRGKLHIFRAPDDSSIPELHTDPVEQSYIIAGLVRRLATNCFLAIAGLAIPAVILLLFYERLLLDILVDGNTPFLMALPLYLFVMFLNFRGLILNGRLYSRLRRGRFPVRNKPYQKSVRLTKVVAVLALIVFALLFSERAITAINLFTTEPYPPVPPGPLPVVRLADIESGAELVPAILPGFDPNIVNHYKTGRSILVPRQWHLKEDVSVPGREWPSGLEYSPSLEVHGYQARSEWVARQLSQALVKIDWSKSHPERSQLNPEYSSYFDALWVKRDNHYTSFVARKGVYVFQLSYRGLEPSEELLALTEIKVQELARK